MIDETFCVVWGVVITALVQLLKKIPFFATLDPKWPALVLSVASAVIPMLIKHQQLSQQILIVLSCIIATFGVSVGTFEVAKSLKPKA